MNIVGERALIFGLGVLVGGVISYFCTMKYVENELEEGLEKMKEDFLEEEVFIPRRDRSNSPSSLEYARRARTYTDYSNSERNQPSDEVLDNTYPAPYVIPEELYLMDPEYQHHDKLVITYYSEDSLFVDDNGDPIENPYLLIGEEAPLNFGNESMDPNVVYIRNEALAIDYEVVRGFKPKLVEVSPPRKTKKRRTNENI